MAINGKNYYAKQGSPADLQILQGTPSYNVEVGEGKNPPGDHYPAHYLPVGLSENRLAGSWFVMMGGKVITYDTNSRLIPAGLAWDKANWDTTFAGSEPNRATANTNAKIKWSVNDVSAGVLKADGLTFAVAGDSVAESMTAAGVGAIADPIGYICYNAKMAVGSDPYDASTWYKHNYDTGPARAYARWGYIQVPIVEVNTRSEAVTQAVTSHSIALYPSGGNIVIEKNGVDQVGIILKVASPNLLTSNATPTQYAMVGRTIFFNSPINASDYVIKYTPVVNTPFSCLSVDYGTTITAGNAKTKKDFIGKTVSFDVNSNYVLTGASGAEGKKIGRILQVKEAKSDDLKLVYTYGKDTGLWQENPGYATDGRNAILTIANAPKYIARIAVNFNVQSF